MQHSEELQKELNALKPSLEEEYGVEAIGIFGSYVRDEQHEVATSTSWWSSPSLSG